VERPRLVPYEAPGWGVGEVWLDGGRVVWAELPRPEGDVASRPPRRGRAVETGLAERLTAFFAGAADDFADVELDVEDGFYGDCARALRAVPRGEVVTYGELAALAGRPGAARAAGTFCARNRFAPFVPCHRVVAAGGIGSFGSLGVAYKRRMLALEHVAL
jgi:methylated-DNA-[protein]-cysteine S-methyltransferase